MIRYRPCGACGALIDKNLHQQKRRALEKEQKEKALGFIESWRKGYSGN
jgi:hypothetical protein